MYDSFYRFRKKPFQLNPDPEFFFNSAVHKRALAYLRYGLAQGEGFIVVTGAPGTGKTMLVKALFESIRNEEIVAGLMVTSQVGAEDTLRIIAATFGLPFDGDVKAVLLKNLENFFRLKAREGKRVLLVVDEAQNLPPQSLEELRMLLNFELDGRSIFQVFMLGQDDLRGTLQAEAMAQVRQRITATYHLHALDKEETRDYILHRLATAGWQSDPEFTVDAFEEIHEFTGGIPRLINSLCDRLLLYGFLEELHVLKPDAVKVVIDEIEHDSAYIKPESKSEMIGQTPIATVATEASSWAPAGSFEERILRLENSVAALKRTLQKERALLRKAILIQLDLKGVYDDSSDEGDF